MRIELEKVGKTIHKAVVLQDINLKLESGKIYGFRGKNGSGKTMLLRCICGFIFATEGKVKVDGKVLGKELAFPEKTGVLIEYPAFIESMTGFENLKLLAEIRGEITEEEIRESIEAVGLEPSDKRKYRKYSLGMKQKLGIAAAVMEHPNLLILDEPTNALDKLGVQQLEEILQREKQRGCLIILASHDREELESLCDEIHVMENGKIQEEGKEI